jgi:hypothetical protein
MLQSYWVFGIGAILMNLAITPAHSQSASGSAPNGITNSNNTVKNQTINNYAPNRTAPGCVGQKISAYGREYDVNRDSGWRGGGNGYSTGNWCNDLKGMLQGEHPRADLEIVPSSASEDRKNTCSPFNCPQYLYHCTIHVKDDPICQ